MAPGPSAQRSRTAHPRVCGENTPSEVIGRWTGGSSPRVRGKSIPPHWSASCHRLIPACAGKTRGGRVRLLRASAHPRVCGENLSGDQEAMVEAGSSPRVRGKRGPLTDRPRPPRLIPACAGKTASRPADPDATRAHPRVCGENGSCTTPPPVGAGLIPACAGKTGSS